MRQDAVVEEARMQQSDKMTPLELKHVKNTFWTELQSWTPYVMLTTSNISTVLTCIQNGKGQSAFNSFFYMCDSLKTRLQILWHSSYWAVRSTSLFKIWVIDSINRREPSESLWPPRLGHKRPRRFSVADSLLEPWAAMWQVPLPCGHHIREATCGHSR